MKECLGNWKELVLPKHCAKCDGRCCSSNISGLSEDQVTLIFGETRNGVNAFGDRLLRREPDGTYSTNYAGESCPQLHDGKCKIYENPLRPETCRQFPIALNEQGTEMWINNMACPVTVTMENIGELCLEALRRGIQPVHMFGSDDLSEESIRAELRRRRSK